MVQLNFDFPIYYYFALIETRSTGLHFRQSWNVAGCQTQCSKMLMQDITETPMPNSAAGTGPT